MTDTEQLPPWWEWNEPPTTDANADLDFTTTPPNPRMFARGTIPLCEACATESGDDEVPDWVAVYAATDLARLLIERGLAGAAAGCQVCQAQLYRVDLGERHRPPGFRLPPPAHPWN